MDPLIALLTNKTLIANVLGLICTWLGVHYGLAVDPQTQTVILGVVMVLLNGVVEHLTGPGIGTSTAATNLGSKVSSPALAVLAAVGLLLLAGCGGTAPGSNASAGAAQPDPLAQIATFAIADLNAAEAEAVAQGDAVAAPCYPALAAWVQQLQGQASTVTGNFTVKGGISGFQAARGVRLKVEANVGNFSLKSIVPVPVKLACSALLLDEQMFLLRLAALAGAGAATAGVAPAIGGILPALGGALPIPLP